MLIKNKIKIKHHKIYFNYIIFEKIKYIINNADGLLANTKLAIQEFRAFDRSDSLPTAAVYNAVMLPIDTYNNSEEKIKHEYKLKLTI